MKKLTSVLGLLVLAAACGGPAQPARNAPPTQAPMQPMVATPPVYALLGQRQALNLTSAQIQVLDSIGTGLQAQNSEAMRQIREIRGDDVYRPRRLSQQDIDRMRPLLDQVRENNRRAQERVQATLTTEQQQRVCELFREGRDRRRGSGDERGNRDDSQRRRPNDRPGMRPGMGGGMYADSLMGPQRVWIFCAAPSGTGRRMGRDTTAAGRSRLPSDTTARPAPTRP